MNAYDFAVLLAEYDRRHAIAELTRAYVAAMRERRAYSDSLLPTFEAKPLAHYATWGKVVGKRRYG